MTKLKKLTHLTADGDPVTVTEKDEKGKDITVAVYSTVRPEAIAAVRAKDLNEQVASHERERRQWTPAALVNTDRAVLSQTLALLSEEEAIAIIARKAGIERYTVEDVEP